MLCRLGQPRLPKPVPQRSDLTTCISWPHPLISSTPISEMTSRGVFALFLLVYLQSHRSTLKILIGLVRRSQVKRRQYSLVAVLRDGFAYNSFICISICSPMFYFLYFFCTCICICFCIMGDINKGGNSSSSSCTVVLVVLEVFNLHFYLSKTM